MDSRRFESLVSRLEQTALEHPQRYLASVLAVTLLGFGVLAVAILFALVPALLLLLMLVAVVATGGKALILLLKLGKLIVLLIWPAWVMVKASLQMLFTRFPRPQGRALTASEAPALFARIDELRRRMQGPRIHHVLLTEDLNAAIVQYPRLGLFGWEENYLMLGLPLLLAMSEEESLAVVAHEYGHLSGHHGRLGGFIYRFRSAWGRMQALSGQWQDWGSRLIARLFNWYAPYFNAYTFVLARQNEYVADRSSAEMAGADNAANALMRINIAAQFESEVFWPAVNRLVGEMPQPLASRYGYWTESMRERLDAASRGRYLESAGKQRTDYLDTHPALADRLRAIGANMDAAAAANLAVPAHHAAEVWLGARLEPILGEFDRNWRDGVAEHWQERHAYLGDRHQSLAELKGKETLTPDERWQYIELLGELEPEHDRLPLLDEFLELAPEHGSALYQRGLALLGKGEATGIADLERVMELDAQAILPACEAAWRFYRDLDPDIAERYRARWEERSNYEQRVRAEFQTLPSDATLGAHQLDEETVAQIRAIVAANSKHVRRAYLLRRTLRTDSTLHDYVLAVDTNYWTFGDKGPEVVKRLAQQTFPVDLFVVHLGGEPYKRFRKWIKRLGVAPLFGK